MEPLEQMAHTIKSTSDTLRKVWDVVKGHDERIEKLENRMEERKDEKPE